MEGNLILSSLILIVSTALFFFYLEAACRRILARQFDQEFFHAVVDASRLEFLSIRKAVEAFNGPLDYERCRVMLKCDFLSLTYLLKNAGRTRKHYTREDWLLVLYFRLMWVSLAARHTLGLQVKPPVMKLTAILQYFANVVGKRVSEIRFTNPAVEEFLSSI